MKPGIYKDIHNLTYHHGADWVDILGSSGLKTILTQSPAHLKAGREAEEKEPTPAKNFGSAYHVWVLEHALKDNLIAVAPEINKRTDAGKKAWAAFKEKAEGRVIISKKEAETCDLMASVINSHPTAGPLLKHAGLFEQSIVWNDPTFGFLCKCRPDFYIPSLNLIVDLKTIGDTDWTGNASPRGFAKAAANNHYDLSAAFYVDGVREATGQDCSWIWLVQEKIPPYAVALYYASDEPFETEDGIICPSVLDNGRAKIKNLLPIYNDCLNTDTWPGYDTDIQTLALPGWAIVT